MGVYIFTYADLKKALLVDAKNERSEHDFGKILFLIYYLMIKRFMLIVLKVIGEMLELLKVYIWLIWSYFQVEEITRQLNLVISH